MRIRCRSCGGARFAECPGAGTDHYRCDECGTIIWILAGDGADMQADRPRIRPRPRAGDWFTFSIRMPADSRRDLLVALECERILTGKTGARQWKSTALANIVADFMAGVDPAVREMAERTITDREGADDAEGAD